MSVSRLQCTHFHGYLFPLWQHVVQKFHSLCLRIEISKLYITFKEELFESYPVIICLVLACIFIINGLILQNEGKQNSLLMGRQFHWSKLVEAKLVEVIVSMRESFQPVFAFFWWGHVNMHISRGLPTTNTSGGKW